MEAVVPLDPTSARTLDEDPNTWRTERQILRLRPYLASRTIKTWRENGLLRYSKRGIGVRAMCLYRLSDIDQLIDGFIVEPTHGPLFSERSGQDD